MSKKFTVLVPFTGAQTITVEAEDETDAKMKAMEAITFVQLDVTELEFHEVIAQGNVVDCVQNEIEVIDEE